MKRSTLEELPQEHLRRRHRELAELAVLDRRARLLVTALVVLPYLDRNRKGVGRWFARERLVANTIFTVCLVIAVVLTIVGTLFRGPNWSWQEPWKKPPAVTESH